MTKTNPEIAVIGYGDAREFAFYFRLKKDSSNNQVHLVLLRKSCPVNDSINVHLCNSIEQAVRITSELSPELILVLDPKLLFGDLPVRLTEAGLNYLGPEGSAINLEKSKLFTKEVLIASGLKTPAYKVLANTSSADGAIRTACRSLGDKIVLKSDVFLADANLRTSLPKNFEEAKETLAAQRAEISSQINEDAKIFAEERITGTELSVHILCDGETYSICPPTVDFKRAYDGELGPNTHGAAALAFGSGFSQSFEDKLRKEVIIPLLKYVKDHNLNYKGFLYLGFIVTDENEIIALEINVRPGNPEALVILSLLEGNLYGTLQKMMAGELHVALPKWNKKLVAAAIFAMAEGYPQQAIPAPQPIINIPEDRLGMNVLPHGIECGNSPTGLVVSGGRVCAMVATAQSVRSAVEKSLSLINQISFSGMHCRSDIAVQSRAFISLFLENQ